MSLFPGARALAAALAVGSLASGWKAQERDALPEMSLEELLDVSVTTASKIPESVDLAPSTVYVVTRDQILKLGLRDLADVLALVPGVDTIDPHFFLEGGQRGFVGNFAQSLILVNGREMNNLIAGETFLSNQFRVHDVKQVEIVNGPGSALYGANAMAGVINVVTRSATDIEGVEAVATAASWGTTEVGLAFGKQAGRLRLSGSAAFYQSSGASFAGFLSDTGRASPLAENNAYRRLPDRFGYRNDATAIPLSLLAERSGFYAGTEYYLNRSGRGTSGIQWDYTQGEDHRELWLTYAGYRKEKLRGGTLDLKLEYRRYWEKFWGNHTEANGEGPLVDPHTGERATADATDTQVEATRGFYSNQRSDGSRKHVANAETTLRLSGKHVVVAGLNFEKTEVVAARFAQTEGPHPRLTPAETRPEYANEKAGLYVQEQTRLLGDRLIVTLGARFEHLERSGNTFNPRAGVVARPFGRSVLKLLFGEAFREPNVFEIAHGERGLRPAKTRTLELGWRQSLGDRLKNDAVVFRNWTSDHIVAVCAVEPPPPCFLNQGTSRAWGVEDVLSLKVGRLSGFVNYTYTSGKTDENDSDRRAALGARHDVLDVPPHKANLALVFGETTSLGVVARYRSAVDTEYHLRRFTVPAFVALDVTVGFAKIPGLDRARIDLLAKNVLDERYFHPKPRAPSVVEHPQEGRSVAVRLTLGI